MFMTVITTAMLPKGLKTRNEALAGGSLEEEESTTTLALGATPVIIMALGWRDGWLGGDNGDEDGREGRMKADNRLGLRGDARRGVRTMATIRENTRHQRGRRLIIVGL